MVVEAPRAAIDAIVARRAVVRDLVAHGWLSLLQLDEAEVAAYAWRDGGWAPA